MVTLTVTGQKRKIYCNYGLGIGNDFVLDTPDFVQTNQIRDPESFEFIFEDLEFQAEVTKLMKKVRGLIGKKIEKCSALY